MDRCVHSFTRRHTRLSHHTQIPYYHFATHTSHAHKPHPLITPPSTAASRHACGRPRRGAVAAVLPHWSHDNGRLPGGRSAHAPAATACKRPRARSVVRTPGRHSERAMGAALTRAGQPASRLHLQALCVRRLTISIPIGAAFGYDTRTHTAQANSYRPRAHPGRMSAHAAAAAAQRAAGVSVALHEVSLARDRNFGREDRNFGAKPRWCTIGPPGFSVESAALPGPPPRTFTTK